MGQLDFPADLGLAQLILAGFIHSLQAADSHGEAGCQLVSAAMAPLCPVSLIFQQDETCSHGS